MNTIQSFSKFSGYFINWNKSEAMPLSKTCFPFMVEKSNFRWVRKGMKYLGIKLSEDMNEIITLNFNPLLLKIKTNLEKWDKIKLSLRGKINIIKMIIAPQFSYVTMMLPLRIPATIFRQLDHNIFSMEWGKNLELN